MQITRLGWRQRLALGMAVHEDTGRRAMDGALLLLEDAGRQAETIAKLADGLFDRPREAEARAGP